MEPLVGLALDSGLSIREFRLILSEAAVRSVAAQQHKTARRLNISGIAATTGISRSAISRILSESVSVAKKPTRWHEQSTNRVLTVWHQDPKYTTSSGKPADLNIYGRGATFDSLVKRHGRGIPTRAVLDELTRAGSVEVLSQTRVRAKSSVAMDRGLTPRAIRSFGEHATELLSTMLQNIRNPEHARFIASVSAADISSKGLPLLRKEMASKGTNFLDDLRDILIHEESDGVEGRKSSESSRVSVTVYYHEASRKVVRKQETGKRKNYRRKRW